MRAGPISHARLFGAFVLIAATLLFSSQPALAQFSQDGPKLVGTGAVGAAEQGHSVALSADGTTAIVGGPCDRATNCDVSTNPSAGATWVYTRSNNVWTQQGSKLVANDAVGAALQGFSAALSADGNTAIVGGPYDNGGVGAAWVFTRSGGVWSQQGSKLVGTGAAAPEEQGNSVALSADGNTAIVGGPGGGAWVYTRSGTVWTQRGGQLVGTGATVGNGGQGKSVALSADGNTAIVGGTGDNSAVGAAWVFTRSGGIWSQQGGKLVGTGAVGPAQQGQSVALSADGNTAIVGGAQDNEASGAAWVFARSGGVWSQQGSKLVGTGAAGPNGTEAQQGWSVALSADGNTAIMGGFSDNDATGATWVFTRSNGVWTQQGNKLVGTGAVGPAEQGYSVALSADGNTAIWGGVSDNSVVGAAWVFVQPALQVTPATNIVASGTQGGPFSPTSFHYTLSATYGSVKYSITTPSWLTASSKSGTVTTSAKTITFTINSSAKTLVPNTYVNNSINFYNTTNNQGNTTRIATLTVNPKQFKITVEASPKADGAVSGGGTFAEGTSQTVTATPNTGHTFVHWTESGKVVSTSESYTFMLGGNVTLVADFK
jgi:Divergent InlB B-repeat domain